MTSIEFIKTLKVGDEFYCRNVGILKVERFTATQLVARYGSRVERFRLKDGRRIGGYWGQISPITQEIRDKVEGEELERWAWNLDRTFRTLPLEAKRQIKAIVEGAKK